MKFLFDNNLSPQLANAVHALCEREAGVDEVLHLTKLFPSATDDLDWIERLAPEGHNWSIVSIDKFLDRNGEERKALKRGGFTVFILDPQWSAHGFWSVSTRMVEWWPTVMRHVGPIKGTAFRVQWRPSPSSRLRTIWRAATASVRRRRR